MVEQNGEKPSFDKIFEQKKLELSDLVKSYGGIMVGHPSRNDIIALARFEARLAIGEELSEEDKNKANTIAYKFKGSFC
ncbi:hypothetical protein A3A76_02725 [Candidatus Woesebacteria bacterium RIFCSPLOWO2_01_FULL_39_23]|nr:MAG: hypothetical protein A3E41_01410 [Candidatus Woesebacteria bacterium RIFCSPHIGHO2_12_FULL_38_9]OGM62563.1 MAG: hypothetical protein A3A76_02725 [Candidatus Woesebacteria bacterium RIFCSPLOWO2_01_FULL_39_23]